MNIENIFSIDIDITGDIQSVAFKNENEVIILTDLGDVFLYKIETNEKSKLFQTNKSIKVTYLENEFDPKSESTIYIIDDIVVIVNDYRRCGIVYNEKKNYQIMIFREDYHVDITKFPIGLFRLEEVPHLIVGYAWNGLHIVNLDTKQIVTVDKSRITEDAEENYKEFFNEHSSSNSFFWPNEFDYFYGDIITSPDEKSF